MTLSIAMPFTVTFVLVQTEFVHPPSSRLLLTRARVAGFCQKYSKVSFHSSKALEEDAQTFSYLW